MWIEALSDFLRISFVAHYLFLPYSFFFLQQIAENINMVQFVVPYPSEKLFQVRLFSFFGSAVIFSRHLSLILVSAEAYSKPLSPTQLRRAQ